MTDQETTCNPNHEFTKPGDGSMTAKLGDGTVLSLYECSDCGKRMVQSADYRSDITEFRDYTVDDDD